MEGTVLNHLMYADDLVFSPRSAGLQQLPVYSDYGEQHDVKYNASKRV